MPAPLAISIDRRDHADRAVITLAGEIDVATVPAIRGALRGCVRDGVSSIDVDMGAVTFCDCSGIGMFLSMARLASAAGGAVRLHAPPVSILRLLDLTGTRSLLTERPAARAAAPLPVPSPARVRSA